MACHLICTKPLSELMLFLSIGPSGTNFSENWIEILAFSFTKTCLKMLSRKRRPFCLRLNMLKFYHICHKQRVLTPGHQGWNDLHSLCRIGMEYYLLNNNDDNNNNSNNNKMMMMMMMMMMIIRMMTMMITGTTTIMIIIIIITTTLTMTIMKMIMIKTAQTPCQSLYKDRRI